MRYLLPSRFILMFAAAASLAGCVTTEQELAYLRARTYERAEVDAINARLACRALARNLLQVARCDGR